MRPPGLMRLAPFYVAGVAVGHLTRPHPLAPLAAGAACLVIAATGLIGPATARRRIPGGPLFVAAAFFAGVALAAAAWLRLTPDPALTRATKWAVVDGRVVSEPAAVTNGYRFLLRAVGAGRWWRAGETLYVTVETAQPAAAGGGKAAAGGDKAAAGGEKAAAASERTAEVTGTAPEPGCLVRVAGFLGRPRPPGNPGEFNFPLYLASAGIRYTLFAAAEPAVRAAPSGPSDAFARWCRRTRDRLTAAIEAGLPPDQAALLEGLVFGETGRLPEETARDFRRSGVYHILAVSGSNVAFVVGGFLLLVRPLLRLTGVRGPRAERLAWPATALVAAGYAVMSGLGSSVVRATLMAEAGLVYLWLGRRRDPWGPLCLAAVLMVTRHPLVILDVGFQLSFGATVGILGLYPYLRRAVAAGRVSPLVGALPTFIRPAADTVVQAALVSLSAQAAVAPLLAAHFGEVSLVGLVSNLIVVPLSGLDVTVGLAAGIVRLCGPPGRFIAVGLFWLTSLLLRLTVGAAHLLARAPLATVIVGCPPIAVVAAYYLALVWVVRGTGKGRAGRRAVLACLLAVGLAAGQGLGAAAAAAVRETADVVFLDVGQGDCLFACLPGGRTLLVDGGPVGAGDRIIGPFLRHRGCGRLDAVVVTHVHDDHVGGLVEVLSDPGIAVGEIVVGPGLTEAGGDLVQALLATAATRGVPVRRVAAGDRLPGFEDVTEVLWPAPGLPSPTVSRSSRENDLSLVCRLRAGWVGLLLPGDLEATGEAGLLGALGPGAPSALGAVGLKVGHHGSGSATSRPFLEAVGPSFAVVSVGENSFGHPSPDTEDRLGRAGAAVFETRADGAVILNVRGRRAVVWTFLSRRGLDLARLALNPIGSPYGSRPSPDRGRCSPSALQEL